MMLDALGRGQARQQVAPHFRRIGRQPVHALEAALQPALLGGVGDVHVLGADAAAIGGAQLRQDFAQRRLPRPHQRAGFEHRVEIVVRESVVARIKLGDGRRLAQAERIEPRRLVAAIAPGIDELQHPDLLVCRLDRRHHHSGGRGPGLMRQAAEFLAHLGMNDIPFHAIDARQLLEVIAPGGSHGGRIAQKLFVQLLEIGGIAVGQRRGTPAGVEVLLPGGVGLLSVHGSAKPAGGCRR